MTRTQQQRQGQRVSLLARRPHSGRSFAFLAVIVAVFLLAGCGDLEDYANRPQRDIYRQKRQLPERTPYPSPALQVSEAKDGAEIPDNLYVGAAEDIFDLVFHPGGEAVLFSYCKAGAACALYSYALASKTLRTVFKQAGVSAKQATYSPDGEWIVFNAYLFTPGGGEPDKSSYQIAMVDKNGSGLRFLTNYDYGINMLYGPNFSPDGRFVIFVRNLDPYPPPPIPLEINRVSIATGNLERLALVKAGYPRAAAYNGNEQEIIFPVLIDWDEKNGEDRREVPCRDSRPVAESNALNWRLCKLNLATGASTTIYNQHAVEYLFPQNGRLPVVFTTAGDEVLTVDERRPYMYGTDIQIMSYDGRGVTPLLHFQRPAFGQPRGNRFLSSASISPAGDKIAYADWWPTKKYRIENYEAARPRFSVRDLKTGRVEEFIVRLPDEESSLYLEYVKPGLQQKPGN